MKSKIEKRLASCAVSVFKGADAGVAGIEDTAHESMVSSQYNLPSWDKRRSMAVKMLEDIARVSGKTDNELAKNLGVLLGTLKEIRDGKRVPRGKYFNRILGMWSKLCSLDCILSKFSNEGKPSAPGKDIIQEFKDSIQKTELKAIKPGQDEEPAAEEGSHDRTDMVNHPPHYTDTGITMQPIECIDIARWLPYSLGCAFKYIWRARHKGSREDAIMDLDKAAFYMNDYDWNSGLSENKDARVAEALFSLLRFPDGELWDLKKEALNQLLYVKSEFDYSIIEKIKACL